MVIFRVIYIIRNAFILFQSKIDEVAYVRFASVYQQFADVESFFNELKKLMGDRKK